MAFGVPVGGGGFLNRSSRFGFNPRQRAMAQIAGGIGQSSAVTPSLTSALPSPVAPGIVAGPTPGNGMPSLPQGPTQNPNGTWTQGGRNYGSLEAIQQEQDVQAQADQRSREIQVAQRRVEATQAEANRRRNTRYGVGGGKAPGLPDTGIRY